MKPPTEKEIKDEIDLMIKDMPVEAIIGLDGVYEAVVKALRDDARRDIIEARERAAREAGLRPTTQSRWGVVGNGGPVVPAPPRQSVVGNGGHVTPAPPRQSVVGVGGVVHQPDCHVPARRATNPNCDGGHCVSADGSVRRLPLPGGAGLILCRACFENEMRWRRERNKDLAGDARYPIPEWESLPLYP